MFVNVQRNTQHSIRSHGLLLTTTHILLTHLLTQNINPQTLAILWCLRIVLIFYKVLHREGWTPLSFGKGHNLAETSPRIPCLITINGSSRNMQGGICYGRFIKCIAFSRRHLLGIAIYIEKFEAIIESPLPYARHTITDSNRCQTIAIRVFATSYFSIVCE